MPFDALMSHTRSGTRAAVAIVALPTIATTGGPGTVVGRGLVSGVKAPTVEEQPQREAVPVAAVVGAEAEAVARAAVPEGVVVGGVVARLNRMVAGAKRSAAAREARRVFARGCRALHLWGTYRDEGTCQPSLI